MRTLKDKDARKDEIMKSLKKYFLKQVTGESTLYRKRKSKNFTAFVGKNS